MSVKKYYQYIEDVKSGKQVACEAIRLSIKRFEELKDRDDIYFDEETVDNCIDFFALIKHFLGKSANKPFILEPWQCFILAYIFGLKWKSTKSRVVREMYCQVARKAGKDAFMAGISLYMLIADGEASPQIACLANSREQARILFEYIINFSRSLDPKEKAIVPYRNYVKFPANNGEVKVFSADASKLDGLNISLAVIDEYHEAKDRKLYDVMKSSMGMRTQPLMVIITTAGFNLESPCHDMYQLSLEILNGVKQDDTFASFIFQLDVDDDWEDSKNFIKCQPNLGITVTDDFMLGEVQKAKNDATAEVGVKTKTFNMWCQSQMTWIPQEVIVKCMKKWDLEDFRDYMGVIGMDLGSVSDFSSITLLVVKEDKKYYKTWTFIPEDTYKEHPNRELYKKFVGEGTMIITKGNVCDYDYIINKIVEISRIVRIDAIYTDSWNATSTQIKLGELGFNVVPFSQAIGNFNAPTKQMEIDIKSQKAVIDKSSNILWQFGNVILKMDHNGNVKPDKGQVNKKIDSTISMCTALGGTLKNPIYNDVDIVFF